MPWVRIPAKNLEFLPLFGIDLLEDCEDHAWYRGEKRMYIDKTDEFPSVWVEDMQDALQLEATSVLVSDGDED